MKEIGHIKDEAVKAAFTAIFKKDDDGWIGWIGEIPGANAHEKTRDELIISLREAAGDILGPNHGSLKGVLT